MDNMTINVMEDCIEILIDLNSEQPSLQQQQQQIQQPFTGGYDSTLFISSEELPAKYTCIICTMVQREPAIVSCCGQHFCLSCLQNCFAVRSTKKCPHCQSEELQHFVNKQQQREIWSLTVKCRNTQRGCLWIGELREMEKHIQQGCR